MGMTNPIQGVVDQGRAESSPMHSGPKWIHFISFVALGTSVLYFTVQLDKVLGGKARKIVKAIT